MVTGTPVLSEWSISMELGAAAGIKPGPGAEPGPGMGPGPGIGPGPGMGPGIGGMPGSAVRFSSVSSLCECAQDPELRKRRRPWQQDAWNNLVIDSMLESVVRGAG